MSSAPVKERRGTATPRWGWSGCAQIISPKLSRSDIARVKAVLPDRQGSIRRIEMELCALGGKYHRYLHQDEFGPTRAERMAALRVLTSKLHRLSSTLSELPSDLRLRLSRRLAELAPPTILLSIDIDFGAYGQDEDAVWLVTEAAVAEASMLNPREAQLMAEVERAAKEAALLLTALDATSSGELNEELSQPRLQVVWDEVYNFAMMEARIRRLGRRIELVLARLEQRRGPEPAISLKWLVWDLCDLYYRETGKPVTSSAVVNYAYTGIPQSSPGRFVLTCVEVVQPSEAWVMDPDHVVAQRRVRTLDKYALRRGVYFAMRDYIATNRRLGNRTSRRKLAV